MFGVRNPGHELAVRTLVRSLCERPVTCGHELASSLGAPRRAMTAALNARMIAHVTALIASVEATLARRGIRAPLMMVKGDGSLTSAASAMQRPVGTVLSGPAASVIGACALSGRREGIVADMGGTTTDIAVVRNGRPEFAFDGALIGGWRPMVEAARVYAIGIGGDSEVRFCGTRQLVIGPRRVVPLSLLGHQYPDLLPTLQRQTHETPHATHARFALRLQSDALHLAQLTPAEEDAWQRLCAGPVDLQQASAAIAPTHTKKALAAGIGPGLFKLLAALEIGARQVAPATVVARCQLHLVASLSPEGNALHEGFTLPQCPAGGNGNEAIAGLEGGRNRMGSISRKTVQSRPTPEHQHESAPS